MVYAKRSPDRRHWCAPTKRQHYRKELAPMCAHPAPLARGEQKGTNA